MRKIRKTTSLVSAVMVLVLTVLALSTATYAWFSADNVVSLSTISFNVDHDTRGDGDLRILWRYIDKEDIFTPEGLAQLEGKTSLEARSASLRLNPMGNFFEVVEPLHSSDRAVLSPAMPTVAPRKGMYPEAFLATLYNSNTSFRIEDGKIVEYYHSEPNQDNVAASCIKEYTSNIESKTFYVYNVNEAFAQRVTLRYELNSTYADALRCAVFVNSGLIGIMGASDKIYYGPIVKGANIKDNLNYVNSSLTYDSAHPEESTGPAPSDSMQESSFSSSFTFDVYDVAGVSLYFYLDGNFISNKKSTGYGFDVVNFQLIGEFIEKPNTANP